MTSSTLCNSVKLQTDIISRWANDFSLIVGLGHALCNESAPYSEHSSNAPTGRPMIPVAQFSISRWELT